jgi:hypothetical protein
MDRSNIVIVVSMLGTAWACSACGGGTAGGETNDNGNGDGGGPVDGTVKETPDASSSEASAEDAGSPPDAAAKPGPDASKVQCKTPSDCATGVCCATGKMSTECRATCPAGSLQLCEPQGGGPACPAGDDCVTIKSGVGVCLPPDAGIRRMDSGVDSGEGVADAGGSDA